MRSCQPFREHSLLGIARPHTQRQLAEAVGSGCLNGDGADEGELREVAGKWGVQAEFLSAKTKDERPRFLEDLKQHLAKGVPALLCTLEAEHWVAVLAYFTDADRFIIMDPIDEELPFNRWQSSTLLTRSSLLGTKSGDANFAILLSRKDGKLAQWRVTPDLVKLCEDGADESAEQIVEKSGRGCGPVGRQGRRGHHGQTPSALTRRSSSTRSRTGRLGFARNEDRHRGALRRVRHSGRSGPMTLPADAEPTKMLPQLAAIFTEFAAR